MRRSRAHLRPLLALSVVLFAGSTALAWKQSRSNGGVQPLIRVPSGSLTFLYEQDGAPSAGAVASHAAWDNARATINAIATSEANAGRGANFNLSDPIDDDTPGGVANDGMNRVFVFATDGDNSLPAGVLAFAAAFANTLTGDIAECDVAFNDADHDWNSTNPDLQGVATHEFIHCYGISHSAVVGNFNSSGHEVIGSLTGDFSQHATMFPFHSGTTNDRSPHADDIAALSDLYPNPQTAANLGTISGNVVDGAGNPVVGAHVVAVSAAAPNTPVVGFFSNTDVTTGGTGAYRLLVPPGNYFVRVEPVIGFPNRFTQANIFHPVTFTSSFPPEFYSGINESANDAMPDNVQSDAVAVSVMAGQTTSGVNTIVNNLAGFAHDNFSNARLISNPTFAEAVDVTLATTEGTDPTGSCFNQTRAFTSWYSFTAPANGTITFSTEGSHYDTALAAFTGSPGGFSEVSGACSEDLGTPDFRSNLQSRIVFAATGGTTYHFLISDSQFFSASPPEFLLTVNFSFVAALNPTPSVSAIFPDSAAVGDAGFTIFVHGSGFASESVVQWNGSDRTTALLNANLLQATIPASDLVNAGTAQVTVFNPAPGGGTSNALIFTILSPVIASLVPDAIPATSPGFELAVSGSNFHAGSVVQWNGASRTTTFVSVIRLTATIPASDVAAVGTAQVTVFNSAGTGGISTARPFTANLRNPLPTITGLSPAGVLQGSNAFNLAVDGSNFVFNSTVRLNGSERMTAFVGVNQLLAAILTGDLTAEGNRSITVVSPGPGGGTSNSVDFLVQSDPNPLPSTSGLTPNNIVAASVRDAVAVQVEGANFISSSVVRWNGSNRATTFNSAMQLTVTIPASDLTSAGTASVAVFTPGHGGGTSNAQAFTIDNPLPATTALSPSGAMEGDPGLTLTVVGSDFVPGSVVRWDGSDRMTTFIGSSQLRAFIPASDLATAGAVTVTVFTPAPPMGGQISNGQMFTIGSSAASLSSLSRGAAETIGAAEPARNPGAAFTEQTTSTRVQVVGSPNLNWVDLAGLEPRAVHAGSAEFTLTVWGNEFPRGAVVRWNGRELRTRFVSRSKLEVVVPTEHVRLAGSARITVFHSESNTESASETFKITPR